MHLDAAPTMNVLTPKPAATERASTHVLTETLAPELLSAWLEITALRAHARRDSLEIRSRTATRSRHRRPSAPMTLTARLTLPASTRDARTRAQRAILALKTRNVESHTIDRFAIAHQDGEEIHSKCASSVSHQRFIQCEIF